MSNSHAPDRERLDEGLRLERAGLLDKALAQYRHARAATADEAVVAESWTLEAFVHHGRGDWETALRSAERAMEVARRLGRDDLVAEALNAQATVHYGQGRLDDAQRLFEAMLEIAEAPRVRGLALQNLGSLAGQRGDFDASERRFGEADRCFEEADYDWGRAHVHNNRAALALERGDYGAAEAASQAALVMARRLDDLDLLAIVTMNLAEALAGLGRIEEAEAAASRALGQFEVSGNHWRRIACLRILGDLSARQGDADLAERMWRHGLDLARSIGAAADAAVLARRLENPEPTA